MGAKLVIVLFALVISFYDTFLKKDFMIDKDSQDIDKLPQMNAIYPAFTPPTTTTAPTYYPITGAIPTTNPPTSPTTCGTPATSMSGKSWCRATQSASQNVLQVGLVYACRYGADFSAIQQGESLFNSDTVRDYSSYAFNSYYLKNLVSTSCNFGGAAMITNTDPRQVPVVM